MGRPKKPRNPCPVCQDIVTNLDSTYCSNRCQLEHQHRAFIERWLAGQERGTRGPEALSTHPQVHVGTRRLQMPRMWLGPRERNIRSAPTNH